MFLPQAEAARQRNKEKCFPQVAFAQAHPACWQHLRRAQVRTLAHAAAFKRKLLMALLGHCIACCAFGRYSDSVMSTIAALLGHTKGCMLALRYGAPAVACNLLFRGLACATVPARHPGQRVAARSHGRARAATRSRALPSTFAA